MSWVHVEDRRSVARNVYTCFLCEREILSGRRYVTRFGYGDEGSASFKMHEHCEYATKEWDIYDWLSHDPCEFCCAELGEWRLT